MVMILFEKLSKEHIIMQDTVPCSCNLHVSLDIIIKPTYVKVVVESVRYDC